MIRREEIEAIEGFEAPLHRGLWIRLLTAGAPRAWTAIVMGACAYAALMAFSCFSVRLYLLPLACWPVLQLILILLTRRDIQWDEILLRKLVQRRPDVLD